MAEGLTVGESVSVQVTRANSLGNVSIPPETMIVVIGAVIAVILIAIAVIKYRGVKTTYLGRKHGSNVWGRLLKSIAIAAILGFTAFMLSGNPVSWAMAAGLFYYEFRIRRSAEGQ